MNVDGNVNVPNATETELLASSPVGSSAQLLCLILVYSIIVNAGDVVHSNILHFIFLQPLLARGRRGVHIPSFRFGSWSGSSSSTFTSTRRKGFSFREC